MIYAKSENLFQFFEEAIIMLPPLKKITYQKRVFVLFFDFFVFVLTYGSLP
jgi:hypothetical protein